MKLLELYIENFLGFETKTIISFRNFNVLVGRNDVGKSSVLKALDLFLNEKTPSLEQRNLYSSSNFIIIEAVFDPQKQNIVIDDDIQTTFEDEELVDEHGFLHVKKTWDVSQTRPKPIFQIFRKQYLHDDFIFSTEAQLVKLCQSLSIQTHKANSEQFNNVEKRTKLRAEYEANGIESNYLWEKLPSNQIERQKQLYEEIRAVLPRFEYFKADAPLSEADTSIQNYFRDISTSVLRDIGMSQAEDEVRARLCKVLNSIAEKINTAMPVDEAVRPAVDFDWTKVIKISFITGDEKSGIPLNMRGDGFRRVTMMAYFEHLAEEKCEEHRNMIFGFEEPETFLHPKAQEQLFEKLHSMAENNYQIIISTHSPIIVANSQHSEIVHVKKNNGRTVINTHITDLLPIANDLGITVDNQFLKLFDRAKVLLLVEGIDDAMSYEHVSILYRNNGLIQNTFEELGIILVPIGGCGSIKHWVNLNLLQKLTKPWFVFLDSDSTSETDISPNRTNLLELGLFEGKNFFLTKKRNLENYIPSEALNRIVPGANLNYRDWENVKDICKCHPMAGALGGKNVAERHFGKLTFQDINQTFCDSNGDDEFLRLFNQVCGLL